jgi:hypothetical protein
MAYLQQLELQMIFSNTDFEHYYRKNNCAFGNAYITGLKAADFMISKNQNNGTIKAMPVYQQA